MSPCKEYVALMADVLFDEPASESKAHLDLHLENCPACAAEFRTIQTTIALMQRRERSAPPEGWSALEARFEDRLARKTRSALRSERAPMARYGTFNPRRAIVAGALIAVGMMLGWLLFAPPAAQPVALQDEAEREPVQLASAEVRAQQVMRRSKVLLLGLVNYDPSSEAGAGFDLEHTQQVANELAWEAGELRDELASDEQQRLQRLIAELEVVLHQIAALENETDLPAIELVKDDVEQQALLLKINITEMQASRRALDAPQPAESY